jgi:hypothetical protein
MTELYPMTEQELKDFTIEKFIKLAHEKSERLTGDFTTAWMDLTFDEKIYCCCVKVYIMQRPDDFQKETKIVL